MTAPAPVATIHRGRPSNAELSARVDRQVELLASARTEIRALRSEGLAFAAEVRAAGRRMEFAIHADRPDVVLHLAARLDELACRHERQRGGAA